MTGSLPHEFLCKKNSSVAVFGVQYHSLFFFSVFLFLGFLKNFLKVLLERKEKIKHI